MHGCSRSFMEVFNAMNFLIGNNCMETKTRSLWARKSFFGAMIISLLVGAAHQARAHTCPPDATATGVGVTVTALRTNGVAIGSGSVAPCEPIIIQMSVLYFEIDPITLGKNAAFEGGTMNLQSDGRFNTDVTPIGGVPLMSGPECVGGVLFIASQRLNYVVTEADAIAGSFQIQATYSNGNA